MHFTWNYWGKGAIVGKVHPGFLHFVCMCSLSSAFTLLWLTSFRHCYLYKAIRRQKLNLIAVSTRSSPAVQKLYGKRGTAESTVWLFPMWRQPPYGKTEQGLKKHVSCEGHWRAGLKPWVYFLSVAFFFFFLIILICFSLFLLERDVVVVSSVYSVLQKRS